MTRTIRAHFDGRVFVPDEPVDLPADTPVEVAPATPAPRSIRNGGGDTPPPPPPDASREQLVDWLESLPPVHRGDMPTDGAKNYRHYLYGHPKQP